MPPCTCHLVLYVTPLDKACEYRILERPRVSMCTPTLGAILASQLEQAINHFALEVFPSRTEIQTRDVSWVIRREIASIENGSVIQAC